LGYREKGCKKGDERVRAYLYDLQLQANAVSAHINKKSKKKLYHIG